MNVGGVFHFLLLGRHEEGIEMFGGLPWEPRTLKQNENFWPLCNRVRRIRWTHFRFTQMFSFLRKLKKHFAFFSKMSRLGCSRSDSHCFFTVSSSSWHTLIGFERKLNFRVVEFFWEPAELRGITSKIYSDNRSIFWHILLRHLFRYLGPKFWKPLIRKMWFFRCRKTTGSKRKVVLSTVQVNASQTRIVSRRNQNLRKISI